MPPKERLSRRDFVRFAGVTVIGSLLASGDRGSNYPELKLNNYSDKLTPLLDSYPEIDKKVRSYEWVRGYLERNISLIEMLKSGDKETDLAKSMSLSESQQGIKHLDNGYFLSVEITEFASRMKENSPEIIEDNRRLSNHLCYLGLLLHSLTTDFNQIGTWACSHGNSGWHYYILQPGVSEYYQATNREVMEEIALRSERIFNEVHNFAQNPECIMERLWNYGDRLRVLAVDMREAGLLFEYQKEAVWNSLHGRIEKTSYYLLGEDKDELEKKLKEVRELLRLPET